MRIRIVLALFLILSVAFPATAAPACREFSGDFTPGDNGERLLALLVSITDPEFLELRMDELPDDDGNIRALSLLARGASLGGFRIERLALDSAFLALNPPLKWRPGNRHSLRVRGALRSNFELTVDERDILRALEGYAAGNWSRILVNMTGGKMYAQGVYRPENASLAILTGMKTGLELLEGKRVMLKAPEIRINGEDRTQLFQKDLDQLQPVMDFDVFPLPLTLSQLSVDGGKLFLATATRPKPVEGIVYRYIRAAGNPFSMRRREAFDYMIDQFQNGDLVFVNGKTWRSKIVNLLEKEPDGFSHTGIIRVINDSPHVIHASPDAERVQLERIESFLSPEEIDRARVYRVGDNHGAAEIASRKALEYYMDGTPFDAAFNIEDASRLYCTELIWRVYKYAGIDLVDDEWDFLYNPVLHGRLLLPSRLSRSPWLIEVTTLR